MNKLWKKFPENTPDKAGYYYTYYHHIKEDKMFYKSFWWTGSEWVFRFKPKVLKYMPESFNNYYIPSMMKAQELLADVAQK